MKIDCHAHIMPSHWPDLKYKFGYGGFIQLEHIEKDLDKIRKEFYDSSKRSTKNKSKRNF